MSSLAHSSALARSRGSRGAASSAYLPEEPPLRFGRRVEPVAFNGSSTNGNFRSRTENNSEGGRIDCMPEPWREIYELEERLIEAARDGIGKREAAEFVRLLGAWIDAEVTAKGFLELAAPETPAVLPVLVRIRKLLGKHWKKHYERKLKAVLRRSCQLAVGGGWLLGPDRLSKRWRRMLEDLAAADDLGCWFRILSRVQRAKRIGNNSGGKLGACCEEASLAVFQTGVEPDDARLAIDFSSPECPIDLRLLGNLVLRGQWSTSVRIDGAERAIDATWKQSCWHADKDGQFLELRLQTDDFIVDRQIFLCRRAPVLFFVDALQAGTASRVELAWPMPCGSLQGLEGVLPTRAQKCTGLGGEVVIVPFGLPADPIASSPGTLAVQKGVLRSSLQRQGRAAVLPIAIIWGEAAKWPLSWRQLTITSDRRLVGADEAVAWRIAIAGQQVVYFRSTLGTHRLAFLGHQTFYETIIGPLNKKGDLEHWLMVDATPGEPLPH